MAHPKPHCLFCAQNQDVVTAAEFLAAQSEDQGKTITWVLICDDHADGWNDGGDWQAPMYAISETREPRGRDPKFTAKEWQAISSVVDFALADEHDWMEPSVDRAVHRVARKLGLVRGG